MKFQPFSDQQILFEDNHLIVVNKRAGELVQGDATGDLPLSESIKLFIKKRDNKPGNVFLGVVHRLDRPTSGIIIFAKTSKALERMNKMFREKTINKTYWAVTKIQPDPKSNSLTHYLKKNPKNNKSTVFEKEGKDRKKAILSYELIKSLENYHLIAVQLETGRHHQIRAQLSYIGCPIKGDLKYGFDRSNSNGSIHLHARKISFTHPVSKENLEILAPLPKNDAIWEACK